VGLILHVLVHEANIQDHQGGKLLLEPLGGLFPRLKLIWADSAYKKGGFAQWVKELFGWEVEIVEHPWSGISVPDRKSVLGIKKKNQEG
jgi:putative transposase